VNILAYQRVDDLDFVGAVSILQKASSAAPNELQVRLVSRERTVRSALGFDYHVEELGDLSCDAWFLPGGPGVAEAATWPELLNALERHAKARRKIYAICSGVLILAHAGLLGGMTVALHARKRRRLRESGCSSVQYGLVFDHWLVTNGGRIGRGVKSVDLAYQFLEDIRFSARNAVIERTEIAPPQVHSLEARHAPMFQDLR
jgi:transcriptional regulator GlxA family with amidase domain